MNYEGNPLYKKNRILVLTFQFSLDIVKYSTEIRKNGNYDLSRQLLKSGTSIGANLREAQNAESKSDFIHKIKIALKEADETEYWLLLLMECDKNHQIQLLLNSLCEILKILTSTIKTLKSK